MESTEDPAAYENRSSHQIASAVESSSIHTLNVAATLTIRVIKSFPYRTYKAVVLHDLDLGRLTVEELKEKVRSIVATRPDFKAYRNVNLDTLKLYNKAQGTKTMNLVINLDDDERLIFEDGSRTLAGYGCEHETEISFFNRRDYEIFKEQPEQKW